jgi:hypothetical protein
VSDLSKLADSLSFEVAEKIIEAIKQAREFRDACPTGAIDDGPVTLHEHLLVTRANIERLEHLAAELGRVRSRTWQAKADAKDAYDDAFMHAATAKQVGFADYSSKEEKIASFDLKALTEKVAARKADRMHNDVDTAWQYVRTLLRGAEGLHRDLEVRIRMISLAGQLDR